MRKIGLEQVKERVPMSLNSGLSDMLPEDSEKFLGLLSQGHRGTRKDHNP